MIEILSLFGFIVGLTAFACSIYFWVKAKHHNADISRNIADNRKLISSTTDLLEVSERIGITAAYENRQIALQQFKERFTTQDTLVVVGSSLKGLRMYVPEFDKILTARTAKALNNRFLLTHPCYSSFREEKEFRKPGDIRKEIEGTLSFLTDCGVQEDDIRLYLGTPTTFTVITRDAMLINPYPYQIESFRCFCLEVERKPVQDVAEEIGDAMLVNKGNFPNAHERTDQAEEPKDAQYWKLIDEHRWEHFLKELRSNQEHNYTYDTAPDVYGQFYWYHYLLPWYSNFSIGLKEYRNQCEQRIEQCIHKRMELGCPLQEKPLLAEDKKEFSPSRLGEEPGEGEPCVITKQQDLPDQDEARPSPVALDIKNHEIK